MSDYVIGLDFGTLSARALLLNAETGAAAGEAEFVYPHGVMTAALPSGTPLPPGFRLQHPEDYLAALNMLRTLLADAGVSPAQVKGVGVDATSCTLLPVKRDGTPLCLLPAFENEPHAWPKLWKHRAAAQDAGRVSAVARELCPGRLAMYGGKISPEWALPKMMETLREAPAVYAAADRFTDLADWLVWMLTGRESRSLCSAGYKFMYDPETGAPGPAFFAALDPAFAAAREKCGPAPIPVGSAAGTVSAAAAKKTGLPAGAVVAAGMIDAHVFLPACGITRPGKAAAIVGTSTCFMLLSERAVPVEGICGAVKDGIVPGYYAYEAGQSSVGDSLQWVVDTCAPAALEADAKRQGKTPHALLSERAAALPPGGRGLLALDWFNGCRTPLVDGGLRGLLLGLELSTRPEEIYRAVAEATAFGLRRIVGQFSAAGIAIDSLTAAGGIAYKSPFMMQLYADVLGLPVRVGGGTQGGARGAAVYALAAARGGPAFLAAAADRLAAVPAQTYVPRRDCRAAYDALYEEYLRLSRFFGEGGSDVMKRLASLTAKGDSHV